MNINDETLYLEAMQEVESDNRKETLWAKALTLEKGNYEQAKYRYVQLRVEQLQLKPDLSEIFSLQPVSPDSAQDKELVSKTISINQSTEDDRKSPLYSFIHHPANLTKITIIALVLLVAVTLAALISDSMQLNMLEDIETITVEAAEANDRRVNIVDWTQIVIILISWILVLVWKYRTNKNCHGFGAKDMRFTPGWAVGWHFVPVMNFFRPYQVMQEIWKVSTDPMTWKTQRGSALIKWWWFFFLISTVFGKYFAKISIRNAFGEQSIEQLKLITSSGICTNCAFMVSTILTLFIIFEISEKQNNLVQIQHVQENKIS